MTFSLKTDCRLTFSGEGPFGLVMCPSRELARQTYEVVCENTQALKSDGFPELRTLLCIGGIDLREQNDVFRRGVHSVIATPGRLKDLLSKKRLNLGVCRFLCLDEADRMVDMGFEDDIREVSSNPQSWRLLWLRARWSSTISNQSRLAQASNIADGYTCTQPSAC